ncbi:MAG: 1-acyl-sn-glycerol-3-phosphate acyltransferase [Clostridia bacterium]|nr:1-acyl-sn-glycerol-3-phosphate acyltransferase [Clostridia bacterium]
MNERTVPIFYACDDNFIKYAIVSATSLIENASRECKYKIHVLHTNVCEDMIREMKNLECENVEIVFVDVSKYLESISDRLPIRHYYTKTTYFRLFIADMFPEYDKVLYIDSDTVVRGDITELYNTDLSDNYVAAAHEQAMVQMDVFGTYCERVVGISRHAFFNAGLMLINCVLFREKNILDKFIALLSEYNFIVTQDEDYLNVLCKDRVCWLDQRWNTECTEGIKYPYDVAREAYIIHYIMANKPWHNEESEYGDIFWSYAEKTSVYSLLKGELDSYTDELRARDAASGEHLREMAIEETLREDNFLNMQNKKRDPERVAVQKKIEQYEREGKFDLDVENDPPSRVLMPDEIDYLRRSPIAKIKTYIAYRKAKTFLNYITESGRMVIRDIKGLENMRELRGGAIITCNHFNPFDTFAMHAAYLAAECDEHTLYRVIREGNYTSFPGFYGYLMRNFYTLPLSSSRETMKKFSEATKTLLGRGHFILIYPEQSMWYNYRKPKPLKSGAYSMAVKNNVPVLPCFITMRDSDRIGDDGYPIQEYTIHIEKAIYPDASLFHKDAVDAMMRENARIWKEIYEREYSSPLEYSTVV